MVGGLLCPLEGDLWHNGRSFSMATDRPSLRLLLAADDTTVSWGRAGDEEWSQRLAPQATTHGNNWDSTGIHMSGLTGKLLISPQQLKSWNLLHTVTKRDQSLEGGWLGAFWYWRERNQLFMGEISGYCTGAWKPVCGSQAFKGFFNLSSFT